MFQMIARLFTALINSTALRYGTFPTAADGVAAVAITIPAAAVAWTFGAWTQIVAAAGVTVEQQIVGFTLENFVGALSQGEVEIGSGAGGAEAALGRFQSTAGQYLLPSPIRVPAATRLAARYRTATGVADTVDVKLIVLTGF